MDKLTALEAQAAAERATELVGAGVSPMDAVQTGILQARLNTVSGRGQPAQYLKGAPVVRPVSARSSLTGMTLVRMAWIDVHRLSVVRSLRTIGADDVDVVRALDVLRGLAGSCPVGGVFTIEICHDCIRVEVGADDDAWRWECVG